VIEKVPLIFGGEPFKLVEVESLGVFPVLEITPHQVPGSLCYSGVTLLYTVVTLLLHGCYTVVTLLLHCRYTVVALL
jgi:hypothetical protein